MLIATPLLLVARCVLARARPRQLERVLEDSLGAHAGEHRLLDHEFAFGTREHHATQVRVLAFGDLADNQVIDVARLATHQRTRHALEQPHWPQVDVLVELAPELEQRTPQ
jgi:hypothetical protein